MFIIAAYSFVLACLPEVRIKLFPGVSHQQATHRPDKREEKETLHPQSDLKYKTIQRNKRKNIKI